MCGIRCVNVSEQSVGFVCFKICFWMSVQSVYFVCGIICVGYCWFISRDSYIPLMLSCKYYLNTVTCTGSKHTATLLSCYHINITLTQSRAPTVNTQLQSCHVII